MYEYIVNNMAYPEEVREKKLMGKVFVQFVINKNGEVVNPRIARGIDPILDNEIIRVVQNMPKWTPGMNNGEPVNVMKTIPVSFKNEPQPEETARDINLADSSFILSYNFKTNAWDTVYSNIDEMPEYPGGEHNLQMDIVRNLRYPKDAVKKKLQGKVLVQFVIDEKGKVRNIRIIDSPHPIFNEEAIRAVELLRNFKPGKFQGKPIKVQYTLPINFQLDEPQPEETARDINLADSSFILSYNFKTNAWDTVYSNIDEMPEYPGGEHNLQMDIVRNLRYPKDAVKKKLQGKVLVQFVIDEKGKVRNIRIIDSPHPIFNEEAIRAVELLRNFKPGKFQGKPIKVQYTLPINFQLD